MSVKLAVAMAVVILLAINMWSEEIVGFFNSENNTEMAEYAIKGIKIYFFGFLFAGFNIVGTGFLSATDNAGWAFITSILRGFVAITVCAIVLAKLFGMLGIWTAFFVAEMITAVVMCIATIKTCKSVL